MSIAGDWTVPEFAELMSQIQLITDVSDFLSANMSVFQSTIGLPDRSKEFFERWVGNSKLLETEIFAEWSSRTMGSQFRAEYRQLIKGMYFGSPLQVEKVQFASPGSIDLAGVGKTVEQVRLFIKDILDRIDARQSRRIKNLIEAQELLQKKIENAQRMITLGNSVGLDEQQIKVLVAGLVNADAFFADKAVNGQVTAIQKIEAVKV